MSMSHYHAHIRLMNDDAHPALRSLHLHLHLLVAFNDFIDNVTTEITRIGNLLTVTVNI